MFAVGVSTTIVWIRVNSCSCDMVFGKMPPCLPTNCSFDWLTIAPVGDRVCQSLGSCCTRRRPRRPWRIGRPCPFSRTATTAALNCRAPPRYLTGAILSDTYIRIRKHTHIHTYTRIRTYMRTYTYTWTHQSINLFYCSPQNVVEVWWRQGIK